MNAVLAHAKAPAKNLATSDETDETSSIAERTTLGLLERDVREHQGVRHG